MNLKQIIIKLHLFLGLSSGLIIFIISITGALYAFKDEVEALTLSYKKVDAKNQEMILPSEAISIGKKANPENTIHGVIYRKPTDALEIIYYQPEPFYYGSTYINPYSGELIKKVDFLKTFFGFIRRGHATLWIPNKIIGYTVVAIGSIIFVIMLITGIILWWPRKNSSSKSFGFSKNKKSIKKLEIHKVIGFYTSFLAIIIVLTGLSWILKSLDKAMYKAMGGEKEITWNPPISDTTFAGSLSYTGNPIDILYKEFKKQNSNLQFIELHLVDNDTSAILVELNRDPSSTRKTDYLFFDQFTLQRIKTDHFYGSYDDALIPDKIRRAYYDIHSGNILGFPGKILAFLVSILCASLPITGFMLWWNKRNERKNFVKQFDIK